MSRREALLLTAAFSASVIRTEFAMENRHKMPRERLETIKAEREDWRERLVNALVRAEAEGQS